jgi:hypothetical protein
MAKRKLTKKKKIKKQVGRGVVYISATFNNTMITVVMKWEMHFAGALLVRLDLKEVKNQLLLQLNKQ